ncbi:MAG: hypothetical protein A3C35_01475 [Omnitrophica bacterium RIFCSPHIGHO2_02_FULL_46_11]|nr:MAG: hypothetical protein A3A81_02340 [Omnitrophica bacterium RIFCSPLOWO2_01_FULL_45_10b]OGW87608.1 MAG: hypothetical protein A3C35_01475 [Omnitrophica bacterium RIFCSPHIGHO2_02_FULL_46_11]
MNRFLRVTFLLGLITFFSAAVFPFLLFADADRDLSTISARLDKLVQDLDQIEKREQELLSHQNEVIQTIKSLKVAAHR